MINKINTLVHPLSYNMFYIQYFQSKKHPLLVASTILFSNSSVHLHSLYDHINPWFIENVDSSYPKCPISPNIRQLT